MRGRVPRSPHLSLQHGSGEPWEKKKKKMLLCRYVEHNNRGGECPDGGSWGSFESYLRGNVSFMFHTSPRRYFLMCFNDFFEMISFKIQEFQPPH